MYVAGKIPDVHYVKGVQYNLPIPTQYFQFLRIDLFGACVVVGGIVVVGGGVVGGGVVGLFFSVKKRRKKRKIRTMMG